MSMSDLLMLKSELERQLSVINEAIKIQQQYAKEPGAPVTLETIKEQTTRVTSDEIETIILSMTGDFLAKEVANQIEKKYSGKVVYDKTVIPNLLHKLITDKKLEYVRERSGRAGAIYKRTKI